MRLKPQQTGYVASKIGIDLANAPFITMPKGKEAVVEAAKKIIDANLELEHALDEKVTKILDENYDEIEIQQVKERELFFMIKKKLAPEFDVILNYEERFSDISHKILDELYEEDLIHFDVTENRIKNIIYNAITGFMSDASEIEDAVMDKIRTYKKRYIPGTDEFDILYEKLYHEELTKRGLE